MDSRPSTASSQRHLESPLDFNHLPAELRLRIYTLTWEPRRVTVERKNTGHGTAPAPGPPRLRVRSVPPVTLHLNFEARQLTLQHYVPCLTTDTAVVYINPVIDTLVLPCFPIWSSDITDTLRSLLSVTRHVHFTGTLQEEGNLKVKIRHQLRPNSVRYIDVVSDHADGSWRRNCCLADCPFEVGHIPTGMRGPDMNPKCGARLAVDRNISTEELILPFRECAELIHGPVCDRELWEGVRMWCEPGKPQREDGQGRELREMPFTHLGAPRSRARAEVSMRGPGLPLPSTT